MGIMSKYLLRMCGMVCLLFIASNCFGQIEFSSGLDLSYPQLTNSNNTKINYDQVSFGLRFGVGYKPDDVQFFPLLNASLGRTRLPLKQFGENVATIMLNYVHLTINENYVLHFPTSEVYIYGGIGFSYLSNKGLNIAGKNGETMKVEIDSTANIGRYFPAINLGVEYNYGESRGKDLYITMGLNFMYTLLLSGNNTYYITVNEPQGVTDHFVTSLSGNAITPNFYLAIHYKLRLHKGSSLYE